MNRLPPKLPKKELLARLVGGRHHGETLSISREPRQTLEYSYTSTTNASYLYKSNPTENIPEVRVYSEFYNFLYKDGEMLVYLWDWKNDKGPKDTLEKI